MALAGAVEPGKGHTGKIIDVSIMPLVHGNSCMNIPCKFLGPFQAVSTILFE